MTAPEKGRFSSLSIFIILFFIIFSSAHIAPAQAGISSQSLKTTLRASSAMKDAAVSVIMASELGEGEEAFIEFNTLPGNTVMLFSISCNSGIEGLDFNQGILFREALVRGIGETLRELQQKDLGPTERFRDQLMLGVVDICQHCGLDGYSFDLAAKSLQCQYQIQNVPYGKVGFNSAHASGADLYIFVTVFFSYDEKGIPSRVSMVRVAFADELPQQNASDSPDSWARVCL